MDLPVTKLKQGVLWPATVLQLCCARQLHLTEPDSVLVTAESMLTCQSRGTGLPSPAVIGGMPRRLLPFAARCQAAQVILRTAGIISEPRGAHASFSTAHSKSKRDR